MAKKKVVKETKKPVLEYGKFHFSALEEVEYLKDSKPFAKGDKRKVHPNMAKLLRFNGIVK